MPRVKKSKTSKLSKKDKTDDRKTINKEKASYNKVINHIDVEIIGARITATTFYVNSVVENTDVSSTYVSNICKTLFDKNKDIMERYKQDNKQGVKYRLLKPGNIRFPSYDEYRAAHNSELDTPGNKTVVPNRMYLVVSSENTIIRVPTNSQSSFNYIERLFDKFVDIAIEHKMVKVSDLLCRDTTTLTANSKSVSVPAARNFMSAMQRMFSSLIVYTDPPVHSTLLVNSIAILVLRKVLLRQEATGDEIINQNKINRTTLNTTYLNKKEGVTAPDKSSYEEEEEDA